MKNSDYVSKQKRIVQKSLNSPFFVIPASTIICQTLANETAHGYISLRKNYCGKKLALRMDEGVQPYIFLKDLLKRFWLVKPFLSMISAIGRLVDCNSL